MVAENMKMIAECTKNLIELCEKLGMVEEEKTKYPKSYEECIKYIKSVKEASDRAALLCKMERLIVCRDAYWKVAGEEMGLGKPWKPDWTDHELKYCIKVIGNTLKCVSEMNIQCILAFPTEEMRDAFKENFDPDIEICKEFL